MSSSAEGYSPWQRSVVWIPGYLIRWPFLSSLPWPRARLRNWVILVFRCQACETVTFQMLNADLLISSEEGNCQGQRALSSSLQHSQVLPQRNFLETRDSICVSSVKSDQVQRPGDL